MKSKSLSSLIRISAVAVCMLGWILFGVLAWFSRDRLANRFDTYLGKTADEEKWKNNVRKAGRDLAERPWLDPRKPVILIGDSHLELCEWYPLFRGALSIRNMGVSTSRIEDAVLVSRSLSTSRTSAVMLMCGINDLTTGRSDRDMLGEYRNLFDTLETRIPGVPVLVVSLMPVGADLGGLNTDEINRRVYSLNPQIRTEAEARGFRFLDVAAVVEKEGRLDPGLTFDGLHLNQNGYRKIAPAVFDALTPLLESK